MSIFSKWFSNKGADSEAKAEPKKPQLSAADYFEQGQKMLNEGKLMQAMEYFQAAIELDKHFEKAYLLLSEVYEKQGKPDKAKAALYALLAVDPNNDRALKRIDVLNGSSIPSTTEIQVHTASPKPNTTAEDGSRAMQQQQNNQIINFKVFEGKPNDWFDYFIIFDDGNRLYFKCKGANLEVVAPAARNWDGFIQPHGILQIPERITYDGVEMMVSSIGESSFSLCREIRSVGLPDTIEGLGSFVFYGCELLTKIDLPNSIKKIGSYAFSRCSSLQEIMLPVSLTEIEDETFYDCRCLKRIMIPKNIRKINMGAFGGFGYNRQCVLILEGMPPQLIGSSINWDTLSISIPKGLKDEYRMAQHWQLLKIVEER